MAFVVHPSVYGREDGLHLPAAGGFHPDGADVGTSYAARRRNRRGGIGQVAVHGDAGGGGRPDVERGRGGNPAV